MKTAGRITTTLALLLSLYLLSYWLLIKKDWLYKMSVFTTNPIAPPPFSDAVRNVFAPIEDLELIWTSRPIRKHLTGDWRSDKNNDFVTLGPNGECHFQLGEFAFKGNAQYARNEGGFIMEFPHREQRCVFVLVLNSEPEVFGTSDQASALIGPTYVNRSERRIDYDTTLTKQPPITPAP